RAMSLLGHEPTFIGSNPLVRFAPQSRPRWPNGVRLLGARTGLMHCNKPHARIAVILLDHLVGEQKERFRDREPKCFRGLEVDSQRTRLALKAGSTRSPIS